MDSSTYLHTLLCKVNDLEDHLLKAFQLIISLFSIACTWSIMVPNTTARPDASIHDVQGQPTADPNPKPSRRSCELAETLLERCVLSGLRYLLCYRCTCSCTAHTHRSFSFLFVSELIDNAHHWESWLSWPASALPLEIRAKLHTWKDKENLEHKTQPPKNIVKHSHWYL